jgi:hypothetical protein
MRKYLPLRQQIMRRQGSALIGVIGRAKPTYTLRSLGYNLGFLEARWGSKGRSHLGWLALQTLSGDLPLNVELCFEVSPALLN